MLTIPVNLNSYFQRNRSQLVYGSDFLLNYHYEKWNDFVDASLSAHLLHLADDAGIMRDQTSSNCPSWAGNTKQKTDLICKLKETQHNTKQTTEPNVTKLN